MATVKFFIRIFFLVTVTWAFFGGPYCWIPAKAQRLACGFVVTLVLGRFFCDAVCPLGIVQTFVNWICHPKRHVRRVCTRLPETKAQRIVRWSIVAVCGLLGGAGLLGGIGGSGAAMTLLPMSVFGKAMALWLPGIVLFAVVIALSVFGDGRIWCNWVCPYGTVFNLISKISIFKNKVGKGCGNCRRCFENDARPAGRAPDCLASDGGEGGILATDDGKAIGEAPRRSLQNKDNGVTRRETLHGLALLAAAEKLTDGGYVEVSLPGAPEREATVLPPGAVDRRIFYAKCVGCQLCIANCPGGCLKPSVRLATFGQPEMDFRHGYCLLGCSKCVEVCPERALADIQREQRPNTHLGYAVWRKDLCVRTTNGDKCTACVRKCPVRAIHLVKDFPVVDRDKCVGCGACEHVCPARPQPAIFVQGLERQRVVNPISAAEVMAEQRAAMSKSESSVARMVGVEA